MDDLWEQGRRDGIATLEARLVGILALANGNRKASVLELGDLFRLLANAVSTRDASGAPPGYSWIAGGMGLSREDVTTIALVVVDGDAVTFGVRDAKTTAVRGGAPVATPRVSWRELRPWRPEHDQLARGRALERLLKWARTGSLDRVRVSKALALSWACDFGQRLPNPAETFRETVEMLRHGNGDVFSELDIEILSKLAYDPAVSALLNRFVVLLEEKRAFDRSPERSTHSAGELASLDSDVERSVRGAANALRDKIREIRRSGLN